MEQNYVCTTNLDGTSLIHGPAEMGLVGMLLPSPDEG